MTATNADLTRALTHLTQTMANAGLPTAHLHLQTGSKTLRPGVPALPA